MLENSYHVIMNEHEWVIYLVTHVYICIYIYYNIILCNLNYEIKYISQRDVYMLLKHLHMHIHVCEWKKYKWIYIPYGKQN